MTKCVLYHNSSLGNIFSFVLALKKLQNILFKFISFCTAKAVQNKTKRQSTEWEKIFASDVTNKGLISKTYKKLHSPISRNKQPNQKMGRPK